MHKCTSASTRWSIHGVWAYEVNRRVFDSVSGRSRHTLTTHLIIVQLWEVLAKGTDAKISRRDSTITESENKTSRKRLPAFRVSDGASSHTGHLETSRDDGMDHVTNIRSSVCSIGPRIWKPSVLEVLEHILAVMTARGHSHLCPDGLSSGIWSTP